jgi:hypothetical protein
VGVFEDSGVTGITHGRDAEDAESKDAAQGEGARIAINGEGSAACKSSYLRFSQLLRILAVNPQFFEPERL